MASVMKEFEASSALYGSNAPFVEELYESYLSNPDSVDPGWRSVFDVSRVLRFPSFFIHAACITSSFEVSYPSTIVAIMSWTNW